MPIPNSIRRLRIDLDDVRHCLALSENLTSAEYTFLSNIEYHLRQGNPITHEQDAKITDIWLRVVYPTLEA